jgi:predicted RNA-binding Zn ribbon-like protein
MAINHIRYLRERRVLYDYNRCFRTWPDHRLIAEWAIDWFYWRKKTRQAEQKAANLEDQLTQLRTEQANEFAALRADIADRDQQLEAIEADLTELPAEEEAPTPVYEETEPESASGLGAFAAGAAVASMFDSTEETEVDVSQPEEETLVPMAAVAGRRDHPG